MDQIIIQTLHGLVNGMVLAMVASGLTLIFGIMDVVNFAHGDLLMLGAFVGASVVGVTGNYWLALLVAAVVIAVLGALLQVTTLRPLIGRDPLTTILATFGVSLVLQKYALWQWGPTVRRISEPVPGDFTLFHLHRGEPRAAGDRLVRRAGPDDALPAHGALRPDAEMTATPTARPRSPALGYWIGFGVVVVLLVIAPLVLPPFWQRFAIEILVWGLLAMSSDILIGYTGMVSFGHSAFFGLGMYGAATALLTVKPPSLFLAVLYGLVAAAAAAAFVAYFATRLRDIYFAISTLVFSQIFYVIIFTWTEVTGGENGLTFSQPRLSIAGLWSERFTPVTFHWFVLGVVLLSYLLVRWITQSPFGMVLQSIRENEPRTRAIGYHVERYKIVAVMLSGLFAGLSGVLYALQNKFAAPDFVFFVVSGEVVIFNVMGGMGTLVGPFAGAAFFLLLREGLSRFLTEYYLIPHGVIFIIMIIFLPQGLLGFLRRRLNA